MFKVYPLVTKLLLNDLESSYYKAQIAIHKIQESVDKNFSLDLVGNSCLFEIGTRQIKDDRLNFETFVHNL